MLELSLISFVLPASTAVLVSLEISSASPILHVSCVANTGSAYATSCSAPTQINSSLSFLDGGGPHGEGFSFGSTTPNIHRTTFPVAWTLIRGFSRIVYVQRHPDNSIDFFVYCSITFLTASSDCEQHFSGSLHPSCSSWISVHQISVFSRSTLSVIWWFDLGGGNSIWDSSFLLISHDESSMPSIRHLQLKGSVSCRV